MERLLVSQVLGFSSPWTPFMWKGSCMSLNLVPSIFSTTKSCTNFVGSAPACAFGSTTRCRCLSRGLISMAGALSFGLCHRWCGRCVSSRSQIEKARSGKPQLTISTISTSLKAGHGPLLRTTPGPNGWETLLQQDEPPARQGLQKQVAWANW